MLGFGLMWVHSGVGECLKVAGPQNKAPLQTTLLEEQNDTFGCLFVGDKLDPLS